MVRGQQPVRLGGMHRVPAMRQLKVDRELMCVIAQVVGVHA